MNLHLSIRVIMLALLLQVAGQASARIVSVHSAADVNKTWSAGDTLVWTDGTYNGKVLTIKGTGTSEAPIVLRAQTTGQVKFTTSSHLTIDGTYIEVQGFVYEGTYTGSDHIVQFSSASSHCRLTECRIESYNTTDVTKDYKWVSIKGVQNRVDHCHFENKTNAGTLLVVWIESGKTPQHTIDNNHFYRRIANLDSQGKELNGQEIIRIGDSSTSMQTAACLVEDNLFEECDGEIETISNKSCGNIYRHNTFLSCAGTLTFRHGNDCTADGNIFYGNGKSATGGVRIIGENHTVINNYFQDLDGNNYRAGICIVRGKENSALNEYFQVKNAVVQGNTFVNCKEAICVNFHSSSDCALLAQNTTIANNTVYNDASHTGNRIVTIAQAGGSITWTDNIYNAGKWKNYSPTISEWIQDSTMPEPEPEDSGMATGAINKSTPVRAKKYIQDGQLLIEIDGKRYSLTGQLKY